MATLFSSVMRVFLGLVLGMISSALLCSSLIDLVSPVSTPPFFGGMVMVPTSRQSVIPGYKNMIFDSSILTLCS